MSGLPDYIDAIQAWYSANTVGIELLLADLLSIIQDCNEPLEGNSFYYHQTTNRFSELLPKQCNLLWAASTATTRICEIGFNAGHSSLLFSLVHPDKPIHFTLFDLCEHAYTKPCLSFLKERFSHHTYELVEGDSTRTIPEYITKNQALLGTYDLVHVDGGHTEECATSDFTNALQLVRPGGFLIVDDTNVSYIDDLCRRAIHDTLCREVPCLPTVGYQHRILQRLY